MVAVGTDVEGQNKSQNVFIENADFNLITPEDLNEKEESFWHNGFTIGKPYTDRQLIVECRRPHQSVGLVSGNFIGSSHPFDAFGPKDLQEEAECFPDTRR